MRGLFLKVFAILWIAQSLIFVISTALIVRQRFPSPAVLFDSLYSALRYEAQQALITYQQGGCDALQTFAKARSQSVALQSGTGRDLCFADSRKQPNSTSFPDHIMGKQEAGQYVWIVPITTRMGARYIYQLRRSHIPENTSWPFSLLHFAFPQLPVAIAVGGAATFVLVLFFARPLARLRSAAGELAKGNLSARVSERKQRKSSDKGDEVQALMHDFNHMAERLESLVGAQRLLLRDVSHELRSPLARLSVALELAREDSGPEAAIHLNRIERETERLNQLISQLLELSSMEALEKTKSIELVSLNRVMDQITPDATYEANQRNCSVRFQPDDRCFIRGNREVLYRAIENVVRNAIRYTKPGSEVEIRLYKVRESLSSIAVVEVLDRGPGIPEDEITNVFRPFYRLDPARSPDTGGFGVGLAITERAVRLHQGSIRAANRENGGVAIRLSFALAEDNKDAPTGST